VPIFYMLNQVAEGRVLRKREKGKIRRKPFHERERGTSNPHVRDHAKSSAIRRDATYNFGTEIQSRLTDV